MIYNEMAKVSVYSGCHPFESDSRTVNLYLLRVNLLNIVCLKEAVKINLVVGEHSQTCAHKHIHTHANTRQLIHTVWEST